MADACDLAAQAHAIVAGCRRLAADGLVVGTAGNVSLRRGDLVAVTATGARFDSLSEAEVVLVDLRGRLVAGTLEPTSELELHLGIHASRGDGAVVHTHAPMSTAVACTLDELPVIHYQLLQLGGVVRVVPYSTFGTGTLAEGVRAALEGRSAALLSNHGAVTTGADLDAAVEATRLLEWGCSLMVHASALGTPRVLDGEQQLAVVEAALARGYGITHPARPAHQEER